MMRFYISLISISIALSTNPKSPGKITGNTLDEQAALTSKSPSGKPLDH